jgi:ComF family protein
VSDLILQLKHGAQLQAARLLGELLSQAVMEVLTPDSAPDLLIPVPLHWQRRWQRGFNQSLELASTLSHATAIPVADDRVKRIKRTPSQRGLTRTQRLQNLRGAFFCTKPVDDLRIAIIDDVMTTGSTVTRLAETLISSGARQVEVWCAARTVLEK